MNTSTLNDVVGNLRLCAAASRASHMAQVPALLAFEVSIDDTQAAALEHIGASSANTKDEPRGPNNT